MAESLATSAVVVRGTHQLYFRMTAGSMSEHPASEWTITGGDRPPWVSTVTLGDESSPGAYESATITTDRPMHEAVTYTLEHPSYADGVTFSGLRPSLRGGAEGTPSPVLLDFHAPWIREDGRPGGFYEIGEGGDYVLTGELETVKKVAWAWLLTPRGSLAYAPEFGAPFELKALRPADIEGAAEQLADGITRSLPWVDSARVYLTFSDDHLRVAVAVSAFGESITDDRQVPQ